VASITDETAVSGGLIIDDNDSPVTQRGICWSTKNKPTIDDSIATDTASVAAFECKLNNLLPNTTYYVRAFAVNANGTGYGNIVSFTTKKTPTLSEYNGTWKGVVKGVSSSYMSGYGGSSEAINETVGNIIVTKISDAQIIINGDAAAVSNKDLSFKTRTTYEATFNMNLTVKKSGRLFYDKIELYSNSSGSYSMMGIDVTISEITTTTLTKQ